MSRRGRLLGVAIAALALFAACQPVKKTPGPGQRSLLPPPPDLPAPPNSPGLNVDMTFVTGLSNPWDMAFLPDGTMFFTERDGPISVRLTSGAVNAITDPPDVVQIDESGMMGIAVDPDFASNRFIYTCFSSNIAGVNDNRVVRWAVNATLDGFTDRTDILFGIPFAGFHDGCRIRFAADGTLWITTGDAGQGTTPQDLNSLGGKVLRINPDGSFPMTNPFGNAVMTFGHRNVQGLAFQPGTGFPYTSEHGPDKNDEVNALVPGGNAGWDPVPVYNQSVPMTDLAKFPDAMIPAWRSGDTFTLAPSGATFLSGPQWRAWDGALCVAFLKDTSARVMFLDANGNVSFSTVILDLGVRLRSVVQGPDGNLYVATDVGGGGGAIWRVVPT